MTRTVIWLLVIDKSLKMCSVSESCPLESQVTLKSKILRSTSEDGEKKRTVNNRCIKLRIKARYIMTEIIKVCPH